MRIPLPRWFGGLRASSDEAQDRFAQAALIRVALATGVIVSLVILHAIA